MGGMLGRMRRTTRTDVGLGIAFVGIAYLIWALVAGASRVYVRDMISFSQALEGDLPLMTRIVRVAFVEAGVAIDVIGILWLVVSLFLVVYSSRQKFSISWVWVSAVCQSLVAALGGVFAAWAVHLPYRSALAELQPTLWEKVSGISLPVLLALALLIWVTFLILLLAERARLNRHRPTLTDGLRTNTYR